MKRKLKAVILAAGKGTRLGTGERDLPKVMRSALGKPLLRYVLDALPSIPDEDVIIVVGYKKDEIVSCFGYNTFAEQTEQLGTGHAVMSAAPYLEGYDGSVLVCCGDMPLISRETYATLADVHFEGDYDCTLLTGESDIPLPYGRIIRDDSGKFLRVVEEKDCSESEKRIRELNSGVYIFRAPPLLPALRLLKNSNAQGEYYLTDVPEIMRDGGARIGICRRRLGNEIIGVNTVSQLEQVEDILASRPSEHIKA